MISLDEAYVDAAAPHSDAIKNGRGLVLKNKFTVLYISEDESILFGECQGSGKGNEQEQARTSANEWQPCARWLRPDSWYCLLLRSVSSVTSCSLCLPPCLLCFLCCLLFNALV